MGAVERFDPDLDSHWLSSQWHMDAAEDKSVHWTSVERRFEHENTASRI